MKIINVSIEFQIDIIESLAREIWAEHFIPIVGKGQVDYRLGRHQSRQAVKVQIASGVLYIHGWRRDVISSDISLRGDELFLSKIYLQFSRRSKGYGGKAVQFIEALARERGVRKITLTVNKNNAGAIRAYE